MSFDIKFDYRYDIADFFTAERKAIIEQAGNIWSSYIQDEFNSTPAGEVLRFTIDGVQQAVTLDEPIDDLIIFVSSVELESENFTLGEGAFFADFVLGSDRQDRIQGDDFEPWLGTIEVNANVEDKFYFDATPETDGDIPFDRQDFLSLMVHEIGHVLGIGTADAFDNQVENDTFIGTQSIEINNGQPIPLDPDHDHIEDGHTVDPDDPDAALDKSFTFGERNLPTDLDLAILADIGYDILAYDAVPVHRFYQYQGGFHFYTADENERSNIYELSIDGALTYNYESVSFRTLASDKDSLTGATIEGSLPVYRFFNQENGAHLYTIDENEKNHILEKLDNFSFDGVSYYAFAERPENIETVPLYRLHNNQTGSHLFTTDFNEFNTIANSSDFAHFDVEGNEGITYYVIDSL